MFIAIWILPGLLFLGSCYFFNREKLQTTTGKVILRSIVEAIFGYALVMLLLVKLVNSSSLLTFIIIIVLLVDGLFLLWNLRIGDTDFDIESETVKNSLVFFGTTYIPFLLMYLLFHDQIWYIVYPLALIVGIVVFIVSLYIKRKVTSTWESIELKLSMSTHVTISMLVYLVLSFFLVISLVIVSTSIIPSDRIRAEIDNTFLASSFFEDEYFDFDDYQINGAISTPERTVLISSSLTENKEYILYQERDDSTTMNITQEVTTQNTLETPNHFPKNLLDSATIITTRNGLYQLVMTDLIVLPETEGKSVYSVVYDNTDAFIIDEGNTTYSVIDEDGTLIETIALSNNSDELRIVNHTILIQSGNVYSLYTDTNNSFSYYGDNIEYDALNQVLYTYVETSTNKYTIYVEPLNGTMESFDITLSDDQAFFNLFDKMVYDQVEILNTEHMSNYKEGLEFHTYLGETSSLNFIVYQTDKFYVSDANKTSVTILEYDTSRSLFLYKEVTLFGFTSKSDKAYSVAITLASVSIALSIFVPYSNYREFTTVIDFNSAVEGKYKKES